MSRYQGAWTLQAKWAHMLVFKSNMCTAMAIQGTFKFGSFYIPQVGKVSTELTKNGPKIHIHKGNMFWLINVIKRYSKEPNFDYEAIVGSDFID